MSQTKTPATEKWLLNEIARIKGDQAKLDDQRDVLREQLAHIEALRKEKTRMLQALKATLNVVSKGATVELDRVVRAHREIGGRGVLADWLKEHLQEVSPQSLDAATLMDRFCTSARMRFWTDAEREEYFNNTFRSQLHRLKRLGFWSKSTSTWLAGTAANGDGEAPPPVWMRWHSLRGGPKTLAAKGQTPQPSGVAT